MANRQLLKLLSTGVILASVFVVGLQNPAGASQAGLCVGATTAAVVPRLVAGPDGQISGTIQLSDSLPAGIYTLQVGIGDSDDLSIVSLGQRAFTSSFTTIEVAVAAPVHAGHHDDGHGSPDDDDDGDHDSDEDDHDVVAITCVGITRVGDLATPALAISVREDCTIPGLVVEITNLGGIDVAPESGGSVNFGEVTKPWWLGVGQSKTVYATLIDGRYLVSLTMADEVVYTMLSTVACDDEPSPDEPSPAEPGPDGPSPNVPGPDGPSPNVPGPDGPSPNVPGPRPAPGVTIPTLSARLDCTTSMLTVVAGNDGDRAGAATVAIVRGDGAVPVVLEPHATIRIDFAIDDDFEGQRSEVLMVTSDDVVLTSSVLVDCLSPAQPVVELSVECQSGRVEVHLLNEGGEPIELLVFEEQEALLGVVTLAGDSAADFETPITGTEIPIRVVDGDGNDVLREIVSHDCRSSEITAELALVCPSGELQLRLTNPGDGVGEVSVSAPDSVAARIELDAGAEVTLVRSIDVGASVDVVVLGSYGESIFEQTVEPWTCGSTSDPVDPACLPERQDSAVWVATSSADARDCEGLIVRMVVDCVSRDVVIDVDNQSPLSVELDLVVGDRAAGTRVVDSWDSLQWVVAGAADRPVTLNERLTGTVRLAADPGCPAPPNRAAGLSALLIVSMSLVALVFARFDPWVRL